MDMFSKRLLISVYVFLTICAFANPILSYANGNGSRLSLASLVTGLFFAFGLGTMFYVTYTNGLRVRLWAEQGAQDAQEEDGAF
jgi:hypothetical protein